MHQFTPEQAVRWDGRWSLLGAWFALVFVTVIAVDSIAARSWLLLMVFGSVPPAVLLWVWNEDQPLLIGSLHRRQTRL